MSEVTEAYESGKAVGRCQGARDMELAIAQDTKEASLRIHQHHECAIPSWAVRTWLRCNVNSNLRAVEDIIGSMVGIAEQRTS